MKPMLPILTFDPPQKTNFLYEVKYDGFRALLNWDNNEIQLTSRNGKALLAQFPEIEQFLLVNKNRFKPFFPLQLDGELVYLENPYKANFSVIQSRGRLRSENKIQEQAKNSPCRMMIFDVLMIKGKSLRSLSFHERKDKLRNLFLQTGFQTLPNPIDQQLLQYIEAYDDFDKLWEKVVFNESEGIVAKYKNSPWEEGKRSNHWLKYKNWKYVDCFITAFDKTNDYISIGVYNKNNVFEIGRVLFGLKPDEKRALKEIIKQNHTLENERFIYVSPAICLEVKYQEPFENELREPTFHRFRFDLKPFDCTLERFMAKKQKMPVNVEITHPDKFIWDNLTIKKENIIHYLYAVAPYMLPFLKNRLLTVIRYPNGIFGDPFFQKNCPDYAPEFVHTQQDTGIQYIVCNNLDTLIWLGNQLAIEFHIPFQTVENHGPSEIVFDLDPPTIEHFQLAVKAALLIKEVLDQLKLISFIKTSGNKGLQVYIPLPDSVYSYDDTRLFTSFIADLLIFRDPDSFTTERLKKNRGSRLYVDYLQHSQGKTIVAPYSLRGNKHAGAATPLFWEEVNDKLEVKMFHMEAVLERINKEMNPFKHFFKTKQIQPFQPVLDFLKQKKKG